MPGNGTHGTENMTAAPDPIADADPPDVERTILDFKKRAEASVKRIEAIGAQIAELATIPEPVAVHATMDSDGMVTSMTIDSDRARGLNAEALGRDMGLALADAASHRPAKDPDEFRRQAEASGLDLNAMLANIFSGQAVENTRVESIVWNEAHTVGITVLWGAVQSVQIDESWLRTTVLQSVADAVRDAVNIIVARQVTQRGSD